MTLMCGEAWLNTGSPFVDDKDKIIDGLKSDLDRLHRQCSVMSEENARLIEENNALKQALSEVHDT